MHAWWSYPSFMANPTTPAAHFPAPVITSADMTYPRDIMAVFAPGMLAEVVFVDEGLACGCTETFTVSAVSDTRMDVIGETGIRYGIVAWPDGITFGRTGVAVPPTPIRAVRTLAHTAA